MLIPVYLCQKCEAEIFTKQKCEQCGSKDSVFMYYAEQAYDDNSMDLCPCCGMEVCGCFSGFEDDEEG